MKTEEILSLFPSHLVENRTIEYNGNTYFQPYESIYINGELINGLRKNTDRAKIFDDILSHSNITINSHLDVGSNLGFFVHHFSSKVQRSCGVELEKFYVQMCNILYPELKNVFIQNDINQKNLRNLLTDKFDLVTSLSMIEYINDKKTFVEDLFNLTNKICIVEGHSEDIQKGLDKEYESLLLTQNWQVFRYPFLTDPGINAPSSSKGRPLWICTKK